MLVKNVSAIKDLDKPCIVMQIWSKLEKYLSKLMKLKDFKTLLIVTT